MTVKFKNSRDGKILDSGMCERQLNLLAHAQVISLNIGSRCGGHGSCGGDRVKIARQTQVSPITENERQHLREDELSHGWRLACQCFPESSNVEIEVEYEEPK
jgi:Na+-transporting NADH:ubiquinone oxidoreductase subunit NqrF